MIIYLVSKSFLYNPYLIVYDHYFVFEIFLHNYFNLICYFWQHRNYKPEILFNFVDVIVDSHRVIDKKYTKTAFSNFKKSEIFKISIYSCCPVWKSDWWLQIVLSA